MQNARNGATNRMVGKPLSTAIVFAVVVVAVTILRSSDDDNRLNIWNLETIYGINKEYYCFIGIQMGSGLWVHL